MKPTIKKIGIRTGGGDVPPLNAVLRAVSTCAESHGIEVTGIKYGWQGLLEENSTVPLKPDGIDEHRGGSILKSSRTNLETIENGTERASRKLKELGIETLIVVGGEDTLSNVLLMRDIPQIFISKTIDNDVGVIEEKKNKEYRIVNYFTLGYPTAVRKMVSYVGWEEGLRTTACSHERIIFVESMGMHAGWLALSSVLGEPDFIIVPEFPLAYGPFLEAVRRRYQDQKHVIAVVSEGSRWEDGTYISVDTSEKDNFGHPKFRGAAEKLCLRMKKDLSRFFDGGNVNFVNPSYLYRSGSPCELDYAWAMRLGKKAVEMIAGGLTESQFLS